MDEIERVNLTQLLSQATPHEEWLAPFDKRLQAGLAVTGAGIAGVFVAALLGIGAGHPLFPLLMIINVCCVLLMIVVGIETEGFQAGNLKWHKMSTALVVVGSVDVFILSIPILFVLLQALFWLLVGAVVVVVVVVVLLGAVFLR